MKKQSIVFLSCSILLSFNAFAPQMFWSKNQSVGRAPSSTLQELNDDRLEELAFTLAGKKEEIKELEAKALLEQKEKDSIACKNAEISNLKSEIDALLTDNKSILLELLDLKREKKYIKEAKAQKDKIINEKLAEVSGSEMIGLMSQFTSLMISQQQQQMMMMQQMFSMMQPKTPQLYGYSSIPLYSNPPVEDSLYSLTQAGKHVGIGLTAPSFPTYDYRPYMDYSRAPSAIIEPLPKATQVGPQMGYNFSQSGNDFQRLEF